MCIAPEYPRRVLDTATKSHFVISLQRNWPRTSYYCIDDEGPLYYRGCANLDFQSERLGSGLQIERVLLILEPDCRSQDRRRNWSTRSCTGARTARSIRMVSRSQAPSLENTRSETALGSGCSGIAVDAGGIRTEEKPKAPRRRRRGCELWSRGGGAGCAAEILASSGITTFTEQGFYGDIICQYHLAQRQLLSDPCERPAGASGRALKVNLTETTLVDYRPSSLSLVISREPKLQRCSALFDQATRLAPVIFLHRYLNTSSYLKFNWNTCS
ncbi:uncharacterized protein BDZ99DRAFT_103982 [Mytilinidion resinicola]|uniref:Uncharacterized protein n=1 Tax=Mytilinidion resinicola TaxID=574789 RepID=A0A6A6YDD5_9PEZI|nr:uncharacterized protein BDZ99DRAFT_103982 [Mytilinidion resinicola]KAF2806105.1 hypothetical protein BDZ99DRAFT_103982 [Mytilinidion resinicola]